MKPDAADSQPKHEKSRWPLSEMLLRGTFGTRTPAERRLIFRSNVTATVLGCWIVIGIATRMHPQPAMSVITLLLPGPLVTYYAWEKRKYF